MAQVNYSREEFMDHLADVNKKVGELINERGVMVDSALYGLLLAASYALSSAISHYREYHVEASK